MKLLQPLVVIALVVSSCLAAHLEDDTCGGTYRGFQYTITSPNYPGNYPPGTRCVYRLEGEATPTCEQQFHLQFLDFNVRDSEGCRADYLQVGDKNLYCGNTAGLRKFSGTNNTLIVTFQSDDRGTAKGFKILVSALPCSLKLSPLKNPPSRFKIGESGRSTTEARESTLSSLYRHRGIRGDDTGVNNSLKLSLNPLTNDVSSSIRRDQTGSVAAAAAAFENNSIINGNRYNDDSSPRITSYLFLPPRETSANVTLHYDIGPVSIADKSSSNRAVTTYPSTDLSPPWINSISTFDDGPMDVKKIGAVPPTRNYAAASSSLDYDSPQLVPADCDKSGQVGQQQVSSERINYDPAQGSGNLVYDPRYNAFVGSNNNYYPGSAGYYPPYHSGGGAGIGYPAGNNYPTGYPGGNNYPTGYPGGNTGYYPGYPNTGLQPNYQGWDPIGSECCRVPSTPRFSIVSPGFPGGFGGGNSGQLSCRYTIVKSSPDVCRLRLNFRFFNFGPDDPFCQLAYVDVDGQRFCGCRSGQSVQLLFTDYLVKTISVFNAGDPRGSRLSGFLIDVIQEPCNTQPSYPYQPSYDPSGYGPGGYARRRSVNASDIVPSPPDPNPLLREKRDLGYSYPKPARPFPGLNSQTHERFFAGGNCQSRLLLDWAIASKEAFFKNARCALPGYGGNGRVTRSFEQESTDCQEINDNQGEIKSPLYPDVYPGNLKKCYRINRAPNFCKLELYVRDFDLETSQDCTNDYLSFGSVDESKRYCGRSLNDFRTVFDLTRTSSLQVDFASDDRGTGRGFDIGFSQLLCELDSTL